MIRKHFDALGWGTTVVIGLGDAGLNALSMAGGIGIADYHSLFDRKLWAGLALAICFISLKTIFAAMKNFGDFVTTEEVTTMSARVSSPGAVSTVESQTVTTTTEPKA
jgi:hypothetical protein